MTDWNKTVKDARKEFLSDAEIRANTIVWVGRQTQSHTLERKTTAPDRVKNKAMQYHSIETIQRMAKHNHKQSDTRGMFITIIIVLVTSVCLGSILVAYIP